MDRKPKRTAALKRLENIREQRQVAVLVDRYDEDWSQLLWVRLDGRARVVEDEQEQAGALGLLEAKYEQYRHEPPEGTVLAIEIERWRGWASA